MSDQGTPNEPRRERETPPSRSGGITAVAVVAVVAIVVVALVLMFNVFGGSDNGGLLEVPAESSNESGGESGSSSY